MITAKVGFVVFGVHKDGLQDPMGTPFINEEKISQAKEALRNQGMSLVEHDVIVASREEAAAAIDPFRLRDDIDAVVLFSGTWVWAAHLIAPIRDLAATGKGIVIWTVPGSQGWRPVGGWVMHAAMNEIGLNHRFVYGAAEDPAEVSRITSYCQAAAVKNRLNRSVVGAFGGRGMGQTCGRADPSQWMKSFGVDIDTRDTKDLIDTANAVTQEELGAAREKIQPWFCQPIPEDDVSARSIRLYIALQKLMRQENWQMYVIQSFPGLGDYYTASCFAQSMMLNDGVGTATLCDYNNLMTVKILTELSRDPVYYGDLQHIDKSNNEVKVIGDGACPPALASPDYPARFAEHGIPTEGEAGGLSVDVLCKAGKGVLARLGRRDGQFEMVVSRCTFNEPPKEEIDRRRHECGIPLWPHAFVQAHCDIEELIQAWNNEYGVVAYGEHLYDEIVAFCEQTDIKAIAL